MHQFTRNKAIYLLLSFISIKFELFVADICSIKDESGYARKVCCADFEEQNSKCEPCPKGYTSEDGKKCKPCPPNTFGDTCIEICNCGEFQRCDNVLGCVNISTKESSTGVVQTTMSFIKDDSFSNKRFDVVSDLTTITVVKEATGVPATDIVMIYILSVAMLMLMICVGFVIIRYSMGKKSRNIRFQNSEKETTNQSFEINEQPENVYEDIDDSEINDDNELPEIIH